MSKKYCLIEDDEWNKMSLREKLEHYISTTPDCVDDHQDYRTRNDFWCDILDVGCSGYNSQVDDDVIRVLEKMLAGHLVPSECSSHDELISYILCDSGLAEYGTSPRGAWICHEVQDIIPAVIERWRRDWIKAATENSSSALSTRLVL